MEPVQEEMNAEVEMTTEGNEDDYGPFEDDFPRFSAPENKFLCHRDCEAILSFKDRFDVSLIKRARSIMEVDFPLAAAGADQFRGPDRAYRLGVLTRVSSARLSAFADVINAVTDEDCEQLAEAISIQEALTKWLRENVGGTIGISNTNITLIGRGAKRGHEDQADVLEGWVGVEWPSAEVPPQSVRAELAKRLAPLLEALRPIEVGLRNILARRGREANIKVGVDGILKAKPSPSSRPKPSTSLGYPRVSTQTC